MLESKTPPGGGMAEFLHTTEVEGEIRRVANLRNLR